MRLIIAVLAFGVLGLPVHAQTAPAPAVVPAPAVAAPVVVPPAAKTVVRSKRLSFEQRFDAANTSKDGKLSLAQAKAGKLRSVVRYFAAIDTGRKGFITKEDVAAFRKTEKGKKIAL